MNTEHVRQKQQSTGQEEAGRRPAPPQPGNLRLIAAIFVVGLLVLLAIGIVPRIGRQSLIRQATSSQETVGAEVTITQPLKPPPYEQIQLPANIQAVVQSAIGARSTGYVQHLFVDIGDHVAKGQVLATISTPDVDQELAQARAEMSASQAGLAQSRAGLVAQQGNLTQAQANLSRSYASLAQARQSLSQSVAQVAQAQQDAAQQKADVEQALTSLNLATVTNTRYQNLLRQGAVDQETADQQNATYRNSQANYEAMSSALAASQANVESFQAAVRSNQANVKAFSDAVSASKAAVATAAANVDSSRAVVGASFADVASNQANVSHNVVLEQFNTITAPFTGIITARNVDTGDLIGSGSGAASSVGSAGAGVSTEGEAASGAGSSGEASGAAGGSLFSEAEMGVMHIYVNVPQDFAEHVVSGVHAQVTLSQLPGKKFDGIVSRTAGALDPSSRTLVAEVRVRNPDNLIEPGMFGQVSFRVPTAGQGFLVDDEAIVTNSQNTQVIVVTPQSTLHFQNVTVGRDFGKQSQVLVGLTGREQLVDDPNDSMTEGEKVEVVQTPSSAGSAHT